MFPALRVLGLAATSSHSDVLAPFMRRLSWWSRTLASWRRSPLQALADQASTVGMLPRNTALADQASTVGMLPRSTDFRWLQELSPETQRHLRSEQDHTHRQMVRFGVPALQQQIMSEASERLLSLSQQDSPPERLGAWEYRVSGEDYVRRPCRDASGPVGVDQLVLGPAIVRRDARRVQQIIGQAVEVGTSVGQLKLSRDQQRVAYTLPLTCTSAAGVDAKAAANAAAAARDRFVCCVRDIDSGLLLEQDILLDVISVEFAADSRSLLYTRPDHQGRPHQVLLHSSPSGDSRSSSLELVLLQENDDARFIELTRSKDWACIFININSKMSSEVYLVDPLRPALPPCLVQPRRPGLEYFVDHQGGSLFILSNARRGAAAPAADLKRPGGQGSWADLYNQPGGLADESSSSFSAGSRDSNSGGTSGDAEFNNSSSSSSSTATCDHVAEGFYSARTSSDAESNNSSTSTSFSTSTRIDPNQPAERFCSGSESEAADNDIDPTGGVALSGEYTLFRAGLRPGQGGVGVSAWRPVISPERTGMVITDMELFAGWCVLYERHRGLPRVSILPRDDESAATGGGRQEGRLHQVPLPAWALHVSPGVNQDPDSQLLHLACSSPSHVPQQYTYHFASRTLRPCHEDQTARHQDGGASLPSVVDTIPSVASEDEEVAAKQQEAVDDSLYVCERLHAVSHDGVEVPITLLHRCSGAAPSLSPTIAGGVAAASETVESNKGSGDESLRSGEDSAHSAGPHKLSWSLDPSAVPGKSVQPVLLVAYGAYGQSLSLEYDAALLSLVDRGWKVAFAHIRGGGELGRRWHAAGRQALKQNSLHDYLSVLDHLVATGHARDGAVAGAADSAGGLVLAAALNARPASFGAAVLRAPFVDLLGAMTDPALPLTSHEYDEWGDPRVPEQLAMMRRLCPFSNLRPGVTFPPVLLTCALDDARVPYWMPARYAARLRLYQQPAAQDGYGAQDSTSAKPPPGHPGMRNSKSSQTPATGASPTSRPLEVGAPVRPVDDGGAHDAAGNAHAADRAVSADLLETSSSRSGSDGRQQESRCPRGLVLLRVQDGGGHLGSDDDRWQQRAEEYAFLLRALGTP